MSWPDFTAVCPSSASPPPGPFPRASHLASNRVSPTSPSAPARYSTLFPPVNPVMGSRGGVCVVQGAGSLMFARVRRRVQAVLLPPNASLSEERLDDAGQWKRAKGWGDRCCHAMSAIKRKGSKASTYCSFARPHLIHADADLLDVTRSVYCSLSSPTRARAVLELAASPPGGLSSGVRACGRCDAACHPAHPRLRIFSALAQSSALFMAYGCSWLVKG